ncbi:MAG: radical SAM/SPASM domain-containing protein [Candidatus Omnitrophota bacterium]
MTKQNKNSVDHLPEEFKIKEGAEKFPLLMALSVSNVCNSKCPSCVYTQNPELRKSYGSEPFMKPLVFNKIAGEAGKYGSMMRLSGTGEPFLNPDLVEEIEYAKKAGAGIGIITNGSLLNGEKIRRILEAEADAIEYSVDAMDEEHYKKVRAGLDFNLVKSNIMKTLELRGKMNKKTAVLVSVVNSPEEDEYVNRTVEYWENIVDKVISRKFLRWGLIEEENKTQGYLSKTERVPCPFPFERLNIDTSGNIRFCGYDITYNVVMGNVLENTIEEIWTGEKFNEWRQYHLNREFHKIPMCRDCTDYPYRSWNYNYWNVLKEAEKRRGEKG